MKPVAYGSPVRDVPDAPHTGARLETVKTHLPFRRISDAPHTGARLETGMTAKAVLQYTGCPPHGGTT